MYKNWGKILLKIHILTSVVPQTTRTSQQGDHQTGNHKTRGGDADKNPHRNMSYVQNCDIKISKEKVKIPAQNC